jgi:hypothetical protein
MQSVAHSLSRRLYKPLAFSLALLLSLLFLAQVIPHAHANNQEEAACRICQVGHVGVTPAVSAVILSVPLARFGQVVPEEILSSTQFFSSQSPSRAPPSLLS